MRDADFERLFADHAQGLFGFLAYRTRDRAMAEDLVADTFERALRARRRFDRRRGSEKAWLYGIALNLLRDSLRRSGAEDRARGRLYAGEAPDDAGAAQERVETRQSVADALAILSPEERETVALRFGGDLTLKEIASATGERVTTVEGRLYRALRKLREEMGELS